MKTNKSVIRSIRISADMAELIDQQVGSNFTEKWENLVTKCVWEREKAEQDLAFYRDIIEKERNRLHTLEEKRRKLETAMQRILNKLDQEILILKDL